MPHSKIWHIDVLDVCVDHWDCMWHDQKSEVVIICQPSSILKFVPFVFNLPYQPCVSLCTSREAGCFTWCSGAVLFTFHASQHFILLRGIFISFHIMIYRFVAFQNSRIVCMVSLSYFSLLSFDLTHQTTVQWEMASSVDGSLAVPGM